MDLTLAQIQDWIEDTQHTHPPAQWAERLLAAAADIEPGGVGRAELLHSVASAQMSADDAAAALTSFQAAVDDGGWSTMDPRAGVVEALLALGRDEEADVVLAATRRALGEVRSDDDLATAMGEVLELSGRRKEAERWFTIGLREFDPEIDDPDLDEEACLWGRFRVRRLRGAALDRFDTWVVDNDPEWISEQPPG